MGLPLIDTIVAGAGVIGLAVARAEALAGREVLVLEEAGRFGSVTSARNSEVVHAGIYYAPGSLKARACLAGRDALYAFCRERGVAHRRCGKLIVATEAAQVPALAAIAANARACGVADLQELDARAALALEPDIRCHAALFSPSTGILDTHGYMQALLAEAEAHGAQLVCNTRVTAVEPVAGGWAVRTADADEPVVAARRFVNAGGLGAQALAAAIAGFPPAQIPPLHLARGVYFTYAGSTRFRHLVYPVPEPGGLGTHLTLDLGGQARFGPDVEWIDSLDYRVDPARSERFAAAAARFWPAIDPAKLVPGYAGIRPKLAGPGEPAADFRVSTPAEHGVPGIINLFGIESPGITSSLALAAQVAAAPTEAG